jgi:tetratricopeptide (TPR) repeat protein
VTSIELGLLRGRVFVELGWMLEAELEVARMMEVAPDSLDALSLLAKIKHIKGELSHAIACWAQLYDLSRRELAGVEHDPRSKELEPALALLRENRIDEARVWCDGLVHRARDRDPSLYKLGVIAGSWLAEVSRDIVGDRVQLEQLGHERRFAHDFDRLIALVRVYDQLASPEAAEAGVKVCRYLIDQLDARRVEKLSLHGLLASLERRAGRIVLADELDARFCDAFRRRMHRANVHDLVRVAAQGYIPLSELRAARRDHEPLSDDLSRRERAIAEAMRGNSGDARALFEDERIDACYLAELDALDGRFDRAISRFLEALRAVPDDLTVTGWLLDRQATEPSRAIADHWDPLRIAYTRGLLELACELEPQRATTWRRLATLHQLAEDDEAAARCAARAAALAEAATAPAGRVLAAGVYHFATKAKGLLHEVWVQRTRVGPGRGGTLSTEDIHGNVTPELRAAIRNTFVAVREYARAKLGVAAADLDDYTFSYKVPKEDERSGGLSAGLPTALAFLSVFLQRPIVQRIASSGVVVCDAHDVITVGQIGEAEHKAKAAYHGNLDTLILPLANREELERSTLVPSAISREVVKYAVDLDEAAKLAFGADVFTRP